MAQFSHLFQPIAIGTVTVSNRILSSAHGTQLVDDGLPNERLIAYHLERARGGVGLIVLEASRVHPSTVQSARQLAAFDPRVIPAYRRLVDALHAHGVVVFAQIVHQGRQISGLAARQPLWAPSPIPCPVFPAHRAVPHAMDHDQIREVVQAHAVTAANLKDAGVDGVELHGAHGYLIQQFMSPFSNQRSDAYGGSLENRLRFAYEVIDATRAAVGPDYPLGMRVSGDEFVPGGLDLQQMEVIAPRLVARGLDFLAVSVSTYAGSSYATMIPDMHFPHGPFVYVASALRAALHAAGLRVPVMAAGRIVDPAQAEQVLAEGHADMVTMTRALIADPELPRKAREGRVEDIRACIGCNQGCVGMVHMRQPITCLVNPTAGVEQEWGLQTLQPAARRKRVLVVGGGPAGLEAARVATLRGHRVALWEQGWELGGQLAIAVRARNRVELGKLAGWLEWQVRQLGVEVRLGTEATVESVLVAEPDAVVLATGAVPLLPQIPGCDGLPLLDVTDALCNLRQVGRRVVVLDDDRHYKAAGIAEHLADLGHEVAIVTVRAETGADVPTVSFHGLRHRLGKKGVRTLSYHDVARVEGRAVVAVDDFSGRETVLPDVDTLIYAGLSRAADELARALRGRVAELHVAGDCAAPRRALEAMREGHAAGRAV
ncbi:MAG: FAD-dependent oxidoreductase [Chloroflexi bacterium]|nr:FAD-dependent oxidoreductase [Chloroflexota bacterium]